MKAFLLTLTLALLSTLLLQADLVMVQSVEGAGPGQNGQMTIKLKGNKLRMDLSKEASILTDTVSGDMMTLMHGEKAYMPISGAMAERMLKNASKGASPKKATLEPTGKHESISGHDTEIFTSSVGDQKATYWIAKDYPESTKFLEIFKRVEGSALSKMIRLAAPQPESFPGIPLKTEIQIGSQKVVITLVSLKDEPVADSEFAIPAGYQAMPMPSIPGVN
jgi:hypothetical protein